MRMTSGNPVPSAAPPLTTVALRNGRRVLLRPLLPTDRDALATAFERLSDESQQLRFGAVPHTLSAARLHHLVDSVDAVNHIAFAAFAEADPERLVGVGRILRYPDDPDSLDVGLTVADDYQAIGLGHVLVNLLAAHRPKPSRRVLTQIATGNDRAMALLSASGTPRRTGDGQIEIDFPA
jgi:RimJ/RimL family protein N-acetyltransferase